MRKRTKISLTTIAGFFLIMISLWFLGPRAEKDYLCRLCGMDLVQKTFLGIPYSSEYTETKLSRWYNAKGLKDHQHMWCFLWSHGQNWGGTKSYYDSFGSFLMPLACLQTVENMVDLNQFNELVNDFYSIEQDSDRVRRFMLKCNDICISNKSPELTGAAQVKPEDAQ